MNVQNIWKKFLAKRNNVLPLTGLETRLPLGHAAIQKGLRWVHPR
jgi:hypothetical protein